MAEYESDLSLLRAENSDSEEPLSLEVPDTIRSPLVFPSGQLLEAMEDAVKVGSLLILHPYVKHLIECQSRLC